MGTPIPDTSYLFALTKISCPDHWIDCVEGGNVVRELAQKAAAPVPLLRLLGIRPVCHRTEVAPSEYVRNEGDTWKVMSRAGPLRSMVRLEKAGD